MKKCNLGETHQKQRKYILNAEFFYHNKTFCHSNIFIIKERKNYIITIILFPCALVLCYTIVQFLNHYYVFLRNISTHTLTWYWVFFEGEDFKISRIYNYYFKQQFLPARIIVINKSLINWTHRIFIIQALLFPQPLYAILLTYLPIEYDRNATPNKQPWPVIICGDFFLIQSGILQKEILTTSDIIRHAIKVL